jgi:hypothetical protein
MIRRMPSEVRAMGRRPRFPRPLRAMREERLAATAWPRAPAIVLGSSWATGTSSDTNRRRRGRIRYRVFPPGGEPFETVSAEVVRTGSEPYDGGRATVAWDPEDPSRALTVESVHFRDARHRRLRADLARTGVRARAVVVAREPTGVRSDTFEELRVTYRVEAPAGPFEATKAAWVPRDGGLVEVGFDCLFVYDPADPVERSTVQFGSPSGRARGEVPPVELAERVFDAETRLAAR